MLSQRNRFGKTALRVATDHGNCEVVEYLLQTFGSCVDIWTTDTA